MKVDSPMPLQMAWPKSKNATINYLAETFEAIMGEVLSSKSRVNGAGFEPIDQTRLTAMVEGLVLPILRTPAVDMPVLSAASYAPDDSGAPL